MRFNDFFTEYKIGLKKLKLPVMWLKPLYRKILCPLIFFNIIILIPPLIKQNWIIFKFIALFTIILLVVLSILDSRIENMQRMYDEYSSVCSKRRIELLISLLEKYNIKTSDKSKIEILIQQAEEEKAKRDPLLYIKQPFKALWALIISILAFTATQLAESVTAEIILTLAFVAIIIVLTIAALSLMLIPLIKDIMYSDSYKYDGLIYDLKQLIIFDRNIL